MGPLYSEGMATNSPQTPCCDCGSTGYCTCSDSWCDECGGEGIVGCDTCDALGYPTDANGDGLPGKCGDCRGTGSIKCPPCRGTGNK